MPVGENGRERFREQKSIHTICCLLTLTKSKQQGWMNMRTLLECYKILEEYPNGMTKDQFYRVARINKQHAKYLLDFGLVPCINTGKKTRKYHIATHDVITYLCDREDHPEKYKVPTGFYIGKNGCSKRHPDKSAAEIIRFNFTEPEKQGCIPCGKSSRLDMMIC